MWVWRLGFWVGGRGLGPVQLPTSALPPAPLLCGRLVFSALVVAVCVGGSPGLVCVLGPVWGSALLGGLGLREPTGRPHGLHILALVHVRSTIRGGCIECPCAASMLDVAHRPPRKFRSTPIAPHVCEPLPTSTSSHGCWRRASPASGHASVAGGYPQRIDFVFAHLPE